MSIFAAAFVAIAGLLAIVLPWAGVLAYYAFSIMQMQYLWPQDFGQARVSLILTGAVVIGLGGATALKMIDWRVLLSPYSLLTILLVFWINLSVDYSPFVLFAEPRNLLPQDYFLETFNKTVFMVFVAGLLINTRKKLEWSIYALAFMLLYYSFWANKVYFTQEFWLFGDNGRLGGPLDSVYFDENYLAMLYVLATPVLYYLGVVRTNLLLRYGIWSLIPLTWHALFLTGSRGGLVSLAATCIFIFFRSYNKKASVGIIVALVLAVIFQGGHLLTRVDDTLEANEELAQLDERSEEEKLDPRLISWSVSLEILRDYPLFGVGLENFINAFSAYSTTNPHVPHNTLFQFATNSGVAAGLIYLWFFAVRLRTLKTSAKVDGKDTFPGGLPRDYLDDLLNSMFLGFFIVAVFLDLMLYELLYFLILLGFVKYNLDRKTERKPHRGVIDSIYRTGQDSKREEEATT